MNSIKSASSSLVPSTIEYVLDDEPLITMISCIQSFSDPDQRIAKLIVDCLKVPNFVKGWKQLFDRFDDHPSLDLNIITILNRPCCVQPDKIVAQAHALIYLPHLIEENVITLGNFVDQVKKNSDFDVGTFSAKNKFQCNLSSRWILVPYSPLVTFDINLEYISPSILVKTICSFALDWIVKNQNFRNGICPFPVKSVSSEKGNKSIEKAFHGCSLEDFLDNKESLSRMVIWKI